MVDEEGAQSEKPKRGRSRNLEQTRKIQLNLTDSYIFDLEALRTALAAGTHNSAIRRRIRIGKLLMGLKNTQGGITILGDSGEKTLIIFT